MHSVLVTGSDRGLGLELCRILAERGDRVFCCVQRITRDAFDLGGRYPDRVKVLRMDVTRERSVIGAFRKVSGIIKGLDVLVNNAAVYSWERKKDTLEILDFAKMAGVIDVNSFGPLRVLKYFLALVRKGEKKLIVNISSEAASNTICWRDREYDYCMSKAALNMASRVLHNYVKDDGIKVLAVDPGWIRTAIGGPDADLSPGESADHIVKLFGRDWKMDDPMYIRHTGEAMPY